MIYRQQKIQVSFQRESRTRNQMVLMSTGKLPIPLYTMSNGKFWVKKEVGGELNDQKYSREKTCINSIFIILKIYVFFPIIPLGFSYCEEIA